MARENFTATIGVIPASPALGRAADPNTAVSAVETARAAAVALQPNPAAFAAALLTLVNDGAVPTQAHVTAVNNAYTTLAAAQTAYVAAVNAISTAAALASVSADVALLLNVSTVTTKNNLRGAIRAIQNQALNGATGLVD